MKGSVGVDYVWAALQMNYTGHHYTSQDGLSLYYRNYGEGDRVVMCLPGLTRNSSDYAGIATHLAADMRVICPDLRGRGRSDWDPKMSHYNPGMYTRDIWTLADQLNIAEFVVIGTSLGGLLAMIMADQQPQRLRGVVLNDAGPEISPETLARILEYAGRMPRAADWDAATRQCRQAYEVAFPEMDDDFWLEFTRRTCRQAEDGAIVSDSDPAIGEMMRKTRGLTKLLQWLRRYGLKRRLAGVYIDPWDSFRKVSMPCLLLRGELSDVVAMKTVAGMQRIKPDLDVVTIPGRGHAPLLDEPESLSAIDRFLERIG